MAVQKISIKDWVQLTNPSLIIDVRSPKEYQHAHIPGAFSLPLFDDEQRAIVGTTYKKQSREDAIKTALPFFGNKMLPMVQQVEAWVKDFKNNHSQSTPIIYVHCWRGGMRSAAVAWLLDLYGFKVYQIVGGYKAYRNWVIEQFNKTYSMKVVGGYTGSGKTEILKALSDMDQSVIDLEGLAHHKGSAFGALGQAPQPSQEMFENLLGKDLFFYGGQQKTIWVEDESQRIGTVMIPSVFFEQLRQSPCYFINIPFEERLGFIVEQYGQFETEALIAATQRIQKRLGGLETKNAIAFLTENNISAAFSILLKYYDRWYEKFSESNSKPQQKNIYSLLVNNVDALQNAKQLMAFQP
jgi:tRNA 2-selenouridine synthase